MEEFNLHLNIIVVCWKMIYLSTISKHLFQCYHCFLRPNHSLVQSANLVEHHRGHLPISSRIFSFLFFLLFLLQQLLFVELPWLLLVFAATKKEDEEKGGGKEEEKNSKPSKEKREEEAKGVGVDGGGGEVEVLLPGMQEEGQGVGPAAGEKEGG